ncbi:MAG: hypothetical protein ACRDJ1_04990 [Actinomycetota bacterium]
MPEEYVSPVGFATEPVEERRRWIGRIFLVLLIGFLGWIVWARIINPPEEGNPRVPVPELPAPE